MGFEKQVSVVCGLDSKKVVCGLDLFSALSTLGWGTSHLPFDSPGWNLIKQVLLRI